jgi:hypothetical protein
MKRILGPATLTVAAVAALAPAGNAFATQRVVVSQTPAALTIKVSQDQSDEQPARITVYMPAGYTVNATHAPGTKVGTATSDFFALDQNAAVAPTGDVVADDPAKHTADTCSPGAHTAVWILSLSAGTTTINLPVYVTQTSGPETARGAVKLELCPDPADVPAGTPGRSPNGAQLLDMTFTVNGVITPPAAAKRWISLWTPYAKGTSLANPAGMVEARSVAGPGTTTIRAKVLNKRKKLIQISGTVTQSGLAVPGAKVTLMLNSQPRFSARSQVTGGYFFKLQNTARKIVTTFFQAKASAGTRDVTGTGCTGPTVPGVPCVSATAAGFTATSKKIKVRQ